MFMKNYIKHFITGCLLAATTVLFGAEVHPQSGILKSTTANVITIGTSSAEIETFEPTPLASGIADYNVRNIVMLNLDPNSKVFLASPTSVRTRVRILRWDVNGNPMSTQVTNLTVSSNNLYNRQNIDKSIFKDINGYKIKMIIDSIFINGIYTATLPEYVYLESNIYITRYYQFTGDEPTISKIDTLNTDCDLENRIDELQVNWATVNGAEEYQLEWIYLNNYGATPNSVISINDLSTNFKTNSTRITTNGAEQSYRISLTYEKGYLAFRVRGVGRDYLNPDKNIYGNWTSPDVVGLSNMSSDAIYYNWREHEKAKNWQYAVTFAEEGKKKEVISYFDGSLHNRQSVTKVNSDKNVIVGETIYDFQGRPAINVLPTPVIFPNCSTSYAEPALQFYPNYNQSKNGKSYTKLDFDLDGTSPCISSTGSMDTLSGSSLYYSGNNPDKSKQQAFVPNAEMYPFSQIEYTPDNTGRIRSQSGVGETFQLGSKHETKYIYSQPNQIQIDRLFGSEVGDAAHYKKNTVIDANGQISVTYLNQEGKTIATSLAGNPPIDVNGNTFLEALPSGTNAAASFTIDAFNKDAAGNSLSNKITPLQDGIEFSTQLSVSYNSSYNFTYNLNIDTLQDPCLRQNYCISCIYDLEIKVTDECGNIVNAQGHTTNPVNKRVGHLDPTTNGFTMNCIAPSKTNITNNLHFLFIPGVYTVSKILTINKDARDFYVKNYLDSTYNSCIKTRSSFIQDAMANIDTSSCYGSCSACVTALGSKDNFVSSGQGTEIQYDFLIDKCMDPCRDRTLCQSSYDMMLVDVSPGGIYGKTDNNPGAITAGAQAISVLNTTNLLAPNRYTGQQGNWKHPRLVLNGIVHNIYLDDDGVRARVNVFASTINSSGWSPDVDNSAFVYTDNTNGQTYTYPENLRDLNDFVPIWNSYFARSLVMYHPEYAYYIACKDQSRKMTNDNRSTEQFDSLLMVSASFSAAVSNGLLSTNPNARLENWFANTNPPHAYDPFFSNPTAFQEFKGPFNFSYSTSPFFPYNHAPLVSEMQNKITNYQTINGVNYSMLQMAAYITRCGNNFYSTPTPQCIDFGSNFYPSNVPNATFKNDSIKNKEWETYKNFYISEKRKIQFKRMNFFAKYISNSSNSQMPNSIFLGGCNACIGNGSYNPYTTGMWDYAGGTYWNSPIFDISQPCSFYNAGNFTNSQTSQKRFVDPSNTGINTSNVAYQMYQQTGQCPMVFQLQGLLNALVQGHYMYPTAQVQLGSISAFNPDLYNAVNGGVSPSTYINYKWKVVSTVGNILTANIINPATNLNKCTVTIDITGTSIPNFTSLQSFQSLNYSQNSGGLDQFTIVASYLTTGNTIATTTIKGSSCIDIHGCQFEPQCTPNQLAVDYMNLLNNMKIRGLATQGNYNMSSDTAIVPLLSATLKNMVGTPNTNMIWNFIAPNRVVIFDNANTSTKLVFTTISVTPSSAASNIVAYSNIRSNYNNLFKMDGIDINGNKIALIEGKVEKVTPSIAGTVGVSMGECGFPEDPDCALTEHKVRKDLEKLLNECLTAKPFTGNINLYSQVNFTPLLQSFFSNTLTATTSTYHYSSVVGTMYDSLKFNTNNACEFEIYQNSLHGEQYYNFEDLISVTNLTGIAPFDANQNFHNFYFIGTYQADGYQAHDTIWGKSCFPIKNCTTCDPPVTTTSDTDSIKVAQRKAYYDSSIPVYKEYSGAVEALNLRNGWDKTSSEYLNRVNYSTFVKKGYENATEYIKYIKNYDPQIDKPEYLKIDEFIYKYGNFTNSKEEYERYSHAVNFYNDKAINAGANKIEIISDRSFYENRLSDRSFEYIKYLKDYPKSGITTKTIYEHLPIETGPLPATDTCKILYQRYLDVYMSVIKDPLIYKICPEFETLNPLLSYNVFEKNNYCCSSEGLTMFNNYINALAKVSTSCPAFIQETPGECVRPGPILIREKLCQKNYILFMKKINEYNASEYAKLTGILLDPNIFPTYASFVNAGYCNCVSNYISYLHSYLTVYSKDIPPAPLDINHYQGCPHTIYPPVTDSCKILYASYIQAVDSMNNLLLSGLWDVRLVVKVTEAEFLENYCSCAKQYIANIYAVISSPKVNFSNETYDMIYNLSDACTPLPCTRTPPSTAFVFPTVPHSQNPCVAQLIAIATQNALNTYHQYTDSATTSIISKYNAHCLKAFETLNYTYIDKEYHFTLYYYDQAGNLIKTIPPEGIELLNINSPTSPDEIKVKQGRLTNTQTVYTFHRMATTYEYNSLNQLVRQDMPDHDKMLICESTLPNGLDINLVINSVQYVTSSKGYLTGYLKRTIGGTTINRGYVYTTNDGGQNWIQVRGLAAGDMQKVQMVSSTVGYAVSNYGLVFKTLDGGTTWDALTTLYNATPKYFNQLNDLFFTDTLTGVVGGIVSGGISPGPNGNANAMRGIGNGPADGGVYKTTDGGLTYKAAKGFANNDTITGLTFDGTNYFASVTNLGTGKIYISNDGLTWTAQTNFATNDLKKVQYIANNLAYAVGYDGTLLRSTTPNGSWTLVATNEPYKFIDVYFKDSNNGIALIDSIPGKAKIYKTFDGGNTWAQLSVSGKFYKTLQSYDAGKLIASGEKGLISKVVMTTPPFGMININGNIGSITDDFNSADAILVSSKLPSLVVSNSATVYFTYDAMVSSPSWTNFNTSIIGGFKKALISVSAGATPVTKGIMLGNNGIVYHFYRDYNIAPVFTAITNSSTYFTDITSSNGNNVAEFYAYDNLSKNIYSIIYGATTANALVMTSPGTTQIINSIDMSNTGGSLLMAGNNGTLLYGSGISAVGTTITWLDVTNKVKPLPLNDIAFSTTGNLVAVGNDGSQWFKNSAATNWQLANTGISDKLNAIKIDNTSNGLIAANNGKLYGLTSANTSNPLLLQVATNISDNLTDVAIETTSSKAFVTTQGGKSIFVNNYTTPGASLSFANNINGALNGVSFFPGSPLAVAVGNKAGVILCNGTNAININDIYTHPLKSVHFYDNNNGYVVDSGYVLRHTNNAGNTWQVVLPKTNLPLITKVFSTGANKAIVIGDKRYIAQINNNANPADILFISNIGLMRLNDINFNQSGYGVIVGNSGYALSVTPNGNSYTIASLGQTSSGSQVSFNAVHVFNDKGFMAVGTAGNIYYKPFTSGFVKQAAGVATTDIFNDVYFHDDRVGYVVGNNGKAIKCILTDNIGNPGSVALTANQVPWITLCPDAIYLNRTATTVNFYAIAFSTRTQGFLAGSYKNPSNTYQRHALLFNDESGLYSTRFWYDKLGRLVISQNTKQFNKIINTTTGQKGTFSYTQYDQIGRIIEVGEKYENTSSSASMRSIFGTDVNGIINLKAIDDTKLVTWINNNTGARKEVTKTYYDKNIITGLPIVQENVRKRVVTVSYEDVFDNNDQTYQNATHYSYDIHGNVKTLLQDNPEVGNN